MLQQRHSAAWPAAIDVPGLAAAWPAPLPTCSGRSALPVGTFSIRSSTSIPSITCPKMVYLPARGRGGKKGGECHNEQQSGSTGNTMGRQAIAPGQAGPLPGSLRPPG